MASREDSRSGLQVNQLGARRARIFYIMSATVWSATLLWWGITERGAILAQGPALLAWVALVATASLLPLKGWQSAPFAADDPICTAAALVFAPLTAGLIVFIGAMDLREVRGGTTVAKAFWNRTQLSLGWVLGSLAAHLLVNSPSHSTLIIPLPSSSRR